MCIRWAAESKRPAGTPLDRWVDVSQGGCCHRIYLDGSEILPIFAMNKTVSLADLEFDEDGPLYVAHKKVYPQKVSGTFRRIKWGLMAACLGVYYLLPFVRWNRGLGAPSQA